MIIEVPDLIHYGTPRHSGRYPWGSGGNDSESNPRNATLNQEVSRLKSEGLTEKQIAQGMGMSILELRAKKKIERNQQKQADINQAQRLRDKGMSNVKIGERMGIGESSVRALLEPGAKDKADILTTTSNMLRDQVAEKKYIDVGTGVENQIGVSSSMLATSVAMLREEGYELRPLSVPQIATGKDTRMKVLCPPGTTQREVWENRDKIQQITKFSDSGGRSFFGLHPPIQVNPDRVSVRYGEDGGDKLDGVIYVRPGVKDIELGGAKYCQVRVAVGEGHYLKGMAMYKDDLPDGVDLLFNTKKSDTGDKLDVMKPSKEDLENPFGSWIKRQIVENPGTPQERVTSAMNIVNEEGDWTKWSRTLSPQMLSKQSRTLAKSQLDMTYERRQKEYESILKLTNPTVRKKMLDDFADSTDSAAVHLKVAALPRQGSHVILPVTTLSPLQVYAPNYLDGERVVLIRYPHGGKFEIPELTVNNNHPESKRLLGDSRDAIGIHPEVATRLSGADFDGDTVLVIPNNQRRIQHSAALEGLKNFDPQSAYPGYEGMKVMKNTQTEMGMISNLITDMSLQGAPHAELVRAVKHSMVVIDAENHKLDYRSSYNDNNIKQLKEKYQLQPDGSKGAATLISRAKARHYVPERKERPASLGGPVDKATGERVYVPTNKKKPSGDPKLERTTKLAEAKDAHTLSSGTPMEGLYADYSNNLKTMANQARLASLNTPPLKYSPSARKAYADQVKTLNAKLSLAIANRPLERQAQLIANAEVRAKRDADPTMIPDDVKKVKFQALEKARLRTGATKRDIEITPDEWDAIQAGAISDSKLTQILNKADMDIVRKLATPHDDTLMSPAMTNRASKMLASGYTRAEVAQQLGVSVSTLDVATVGEG